MKIFVYGYLLACCCIVAACQPSDKIHQTSAPVAAKSLLQQPFRYHKLIEVAPGLDYDIFSWGRGPAQSAAYLILRSDSVNKKYTTTTGDIDGRLIDAFNTDLDTDGNPEIFIQAQTADSTGYDKIEAYEYNEGGAHKLEFPKLTSSQKKGYHGGDDFMVKDNKLIRTFTIYDSDNSKAKPTSARRQLEYSYHGNSFSVKQLSTDSSGVASAAKSSVIEPKKEVAKQEAHHSEHHSTRHESRRERRRQAAKEKHRAAVHHRKTAKHHRRRR